MSELQSSSICNRGKYEAAFARRGDVTEVKAFEIHNVFFAMTDGEGRHPSEEAYGVCLIAQLGDVAVKRALEGADFDITILNRDFQPTREITVSIDDSCRILQPAEIVYVASYRRYNLTRGVVTEYADGIDPLVTTWVADGMRQAFSSSSRESELIAA